ncbi:MAG TPA: CRTAC1 family protein [Bryobacteraceae bacterium]|nr:CRTAC1 family protein [Bryobacteraceae bacterium]HOQ45587.1 CRTAC1 family protein [Bryobacteraceae bacterium]HPU72780.1 CRTAC1 family protein [Bryobacteraceae bacterium]
MDGMFLRRGSVWLLAAAGIAVWGGAHAPENTPPDPVRLTDIAARAGVRFVLNNSATPQKHQIETMVSGVAVFDYNNDKRPDIYFVNGALQPKLEKVSPAYYNRLYRNNGDGTFTDTTDEAGVRGEGFATGVATADYDNDGFTDIFIAGVNRNILYRNRGDGTFEDVTVKAGLHIAGPKRPWSISAGWFDYDNDGHLDLLVVNYVTWIPEKEPFCGDLARNVRTYCHPKYYEGLPNILYHNNGDGTFTDVSESSGIASHIGKGMAVTFADYDNDGLLDVFVTNDTTPNFLFHNEGGGRFREVGLRAGVAFNEDGRALSSMGADFRDVDNDGQEDIFVSALANETFPLFRALRGGLFADVTYPSGLGRLTLPYSGWSLGIFDLNNDGFKDLFVACGDVNDNTELLSSRTSRQRNMVLVNRGVGAAFVHDEQACPREVSMHRGAAFGDFDGDGRVDIAVSRIGEPAVIYRNVSPAPNHWLALRLTGRKSNRDAIGARIHLVSASGREQWNHVTTSTGYACSSDKTVFFGLGKDASARRIEIVWPSGTRQVLENVAADRYLDIEEPSS